MGIWDTRKDREIWETRKTRKATGNGEIGENRYTRENLGTSWNPGEFRGLMCLGEPEDLEIPALGDCEIREFRKHREIREIRLLKNLREIGQNRYLWPKCETLSGRTHGLPTNWKIEVLGDSADWKLRESGRFGSLGNSGVWGIREFRENHYM